MRLVICVFCLYLLTANVYAQPGQATLLAKLQSATSDSQKITAYKDLISYFRYLNSDSGFYYGELGLQAAIRARYVPGEASMLYELALIDKKQGRVDMADMRFNSALQLYTQTGNKEGIALTHSNIGAIECEKGNFDIGLKHFVTALKIQDSLGNYHGLMVTYMNIGSLYMIRNDSANAGKYFKLASDVSKKIPIDDETISLYNTIGIYKVSEGDTAGALKTFLNNLEISDRPQFISSHIECLNYLGNFYIDKGMPGKALPYLDEGLKLARSNKMPEEEGNILMLIAVLIKPTDPGLALKYLKNAKAIADNIHNRVFKITVCDEIARLQKEEGDFKGALETVEEKQRIRDSIYSIDKEREIASIAATADLEKSNKKVNQLQDLIYRSVNRLNLIIAVAVIIILILIVMLFFYRKTVRLNRKLILHEKELEELNSTKDKLFSVIGHDLRGPIARIPAILDLYEDAQTSEEEKQFLMSSLREHTKSSLETFDKLLYWGLSLVKGIRIHQIDMQTKPYIRGSIELRKLKAMEKNITVKDNTPEDLHIFADPTHFDFIIRNLVGNALKYTFRDGTIEIDADSVSRPGFTIFSVKDSGTGIDEKRLQKIFTGLNSTKGTENEKGNGIGLMLCREFTLQNGGEIWVTSEPGKGTTFYFSLKNHA